MAVASTALTLLPGKSKTDFWTRIDLWLARNFSDSRACTLHELRRWVECQTIGLKDNIGLLVGLAADHSMPGMPSEDWGPDAFEAWREVLASKIAQAYYEYDQARGDESKMADYEIYR